MRETEPISACVHDIRWPDNSMVYRGYAINGAIAIHIWQCKHCGEAYEKQWYRWRESDCPQHMQEFVGWEFHDDKDRYQLGRRWICSMCGKTWVEACDVRSYGNPEITIDNPEVERCLLWTPSVAERKLKGET